MCDVSTFFYSLLYILYIYYLCLRYGTLLRAFVLASLAIQCSEACGQTNAAKPVKFECFELKNEF